MQSSYDSDGDQIVTMRVLNQRGTEVERLVTEFVSDEDP